MNRHPPRRIQGPLLQALLAVQKKFPTPLYLVGGSVRKLFVQELPQMPCPVLDIEDLDIALASGAHIAASMLASQLKGKRITLDDERKIHRVVAEIGGKKFQIDFADFKGKTIEEDLAARDFTINAMAIPLLEIGRVAPVRGLRSRGTLVSTTGMAGDRPRPALIDPFNGRADAKRKLLRAVSEKNLKDDPLRILRACRLSATLGFCIEPKSLRWVKKHAKLLKRPAPERIRFEFMRILNTGNAAAILKGMDQTRLLTALFPVLERSRNLARQYYKAGGVLGHSLDSVQCFEDNMRELRKRLPKISRELEAYVREPIAGGFPRMATLKLAVLFHDMAKPHTAKWIEGRMRFFQHDEKGAELFTALGSKLRLSGAEIELTAKIIRAHLRPGNLSEQPGVTDRAIYRFFRDLGPDGVGVLLSAAADHQSYIPKARRWSPKEKSIYVISVMLKRYYEDSKKVVPPKIINGHDVMKTLKIPPGREIGKILEEVQSAQAEGKVKNRKDALIYIMRFAKKEHAA